MKKAKASRNLERDRGAVAMRSIQYNRRGDKGLGEALSWIFRMCRNQDTWAIMSSSTLSFRNSVSLGEIRLSERSGFDCSFYLRCMFLNDSTSIPPNVYFSNHKGKGNNCEKCKNIIKTLAHAAKAPGC